MKDKKTMALIGSYAKWTQHQMFDTCFLHLCSLTMDEVICYKDPTTLPYIKEYAEKNNCLSNVKLRRLYVIKSQKNPYINLICSFINVFNNIYYYIRTFKSNLLVYNYNDIYSLYPIYYLNKLFKRKVFVVCHGEMELLVSEDCGRLASFNRKLLRRFFFSDKEDKNIKFIVLGQSILENIKKTIYGKWSNHFYSIDHPYYFPKSKPVSSFNEHLHFGLVGTVSEAKGLNDFFHLVEVLEKEKVSCSFTIIGRVNSHKYDTYLKEHHINVTWKYLSRDEFERKINSVDILLYFYPSTSYKLIASGAIFDALNSNKPIMALRNDYFEYVINKSKYPAMLFKDTSDMSRAIINREFESFFRTKNISNKDVFSPETIAESLNPMFWEG